MEENAAKANEQAGQVIRLAEEKARSEAAEKIARAKKEADGILKIAESRMDQAALKIVEGIVDRL